MLELQFSDYILECGTDEAGRGCLSGPVTAAAVILPHNYNNPLLKDSKLTSHKLRLSLAADIKAKALSFGIAHVFPETIDRINILNASILAMHKAIEQLKPQPEFIAVDGNRFKAYQNIPHQTVIKGDGKYMNIAAASILAKTTRDSFMEKIHFDYPHYHWDKNKGYPTKAHRLGLESHGACEYHRQSFKLLANQNNLDF
jgi:ribonuclease HII